jgi:nucleotide-binding universal stress UspA family protein
VSSGRDRERPRIVVGVDGFEPSKAALRWAIDQAKLTGAIVEAVTAWHIPAGTSGISAADLPDYPQDARAVLTESITESSTSDSGVEIRCYVVEGRAGQALVDAAEGAGLLVVGCRGHGDLTETMLGSVAQFCSHYAPCPVVIMRGRH